MRYDAALYYPTTEHLELEADTPEEAANRAYARSDAAQRAMAEGDAVDFVITDLSTGEEAGVGTIERVTQGEDPDDRRPSNIKEIGMYLHCGLCLAAVPDMESPQEWAALEVGWTTEGLQIWCHRHDVNVAHIDFQGRIHPANTTRGQSREEIAEEARHDAPGTAPGDGK